jgi:hypothetical protein
MIVYEFHLKSTERGRTFEDLCASFYRLGTCRRKVDGETGSAVYGVSLNPNTWWMQLLVDDNTPPGVIAAVEAEVSRVMEDQFMKYPHSRDNAPPAERSKT